MRYSGKGAPRTQVRFDSSPYWVPRSEAMRSLPDLAFRVLNYLCSRQDWNTHAVPRMSVSDIADAIGRSRNATARAINELALAQVITAQRTYRSMRIVILFAPPSYPVVKHLPLNAYVASSDESDAPIQCE